MTGFKVGDRVRVIGNTVIGHHFYIGEEVEIENVVDTERYGARATERSRNHFQIVYVDDLELIEECGTMAHNNGDLIKAQVSRDDYGAPVYNLFVKFGEFYYNLSTGKQMRGAKSLPRGSRHTVGTMAGTGDHMIAAIEGSDTTPEVVDKSVPFDDGHHFAVWHDDGELTKKVEYGPITASEIEKRNKQALKALEEFNKAFPESGLMTTDKLSDVDFVEIKET